MTELKIEYRPISQLHKYAGNPRIHSDDQIAQLVASIQEFGFINPILIDEDDTIIAGHGRREAAELSGLDEVPTITLTGLTQEQRRALVIADNKLTENGGWNTDSLLNEIRAISESGYDTDILGFSEAEMKRLFKDKSSGSGEGEGGNPVIQYNIVFEDEFQQDRWYEYLAWLRVNYEGETIAERLVAHIDATLPEEE